MLGDRFPRTPFGQLLAVSLIALLTTSCGGDGGSGGGGGVIAVMPTPAPPPPPPAPVPPPPPPPAAFTPAAAAIPKTGGTLRLGKCVNLSNMLEAPNEGDWGRAFQDSRHRQHQGEGLHRGPAAGALLRPCAGGAALHDRPRRS